ncbi:unnamed protein product [Coregonus sp. 'balchen']|nr:unnamed protein product [Coregonus sp. 'balchen']
MPSGAIRDQVFGGLTRLRTMYINSNRITYENDSKLNPSPPSLTCHLSNIWISSASVQKECIIYRQTFLTSCFTQSQTQANLSVNI